MSRRNDDSGQLHTMEGVIAGLMMVLALSYIIGSVTLLSPQTEKTTIVKLTIKAEDTLMVLGAIDQPSNASSPLLRDIAMWRGGEANPSKFGAGEASISRLNDSLFSMMPQNVFYNVNLTYYEPATGKIETKYLIYMGEPEGNSASASKTILLNQGDINNTLSPSQKWKDMEMPKVVEVRLILWSI